MVCGLQRGGGKKSTSLKPPADAKVQPGKRKKIDRDRGRETRDNDRESAKERQRDRDINREDSETSQLTKIKQRHRIKRDI